jgi:hypothetical protein
MCDSLRDFRSGLSLALGLGDFGAQVLRPRCAYRMVEGDLLALDGDNPALLLSAPA